MASINVDGAGGTRYAGRRRHDRQRHFDVNGATIDLVTLLTRQPCQHGQPAWKPWCSTPSTATTRSAHRHTRSTRRFRRHALGRRAIGLRQRHAEWQRGRRQSCSPPARHADRHRRRTGNVNVNGVEVLNLNNGAAASRQRDGRAPTRISMRRPTAPHRPELPWRASIRS